jgi:hypothetical protein
MDGLEFQQHSGLSDSRPEVMSPAVGNLVPNRKKVKS